MTLETFAIKSSLYLIVPSVSMSTLCSLTIYILYRNELKKAEIRKYFEISLLIGIILYTGSFVLILPALSIIVVNQLKNNNQKRNTIILTYIYSVYFLDFMLNFVYIFLGKAYLATSFKSMLLKGLIMLALIPLSFLLKATILKNKIHKNISKDAMRLKIIIKIIVPLCIIFTMILLIIFFNMLNQEKLAFVLGNITPQLIPLILIIFACVLVYNYDLGFEFRDKLSREINEKHEIEEYSRIIEDMYSETRKFKHDYMNMLLPLKAYIDSGNIEETKNFFYDNVLHMDKNIRWNNSNIDKLIYIKIVELKAALSAKLITAMGMNINIRVELVEDIEYISMNLVDLCRIVGILMDNAIEASNECEYPNIKVCVVNNGNYVIIVVKNNFFGDKPVVHKIFKEGFSTKGQDRGLGLYIVKDIIDKKYDNVSLNTIIEDKMFTQELWVKYEEGEVS